MKDTRCVAKVKEEVKLIGSSSRIETTVAASRSPSSREACAARRCSSTSTMHMVEK
jgi:hypothetical protein